MDVVDVLRLAHADPTLLKDEERLGGLGLTTAELTMIRQLDPDTVRIIAEQIERKIRGSELASSQACTGGTQACVGRPGLSAQQLTAPTVKPG